MKNKRIATILAFFLGGFGVHRFYLGQPILGLIYLLFFWTFIPFLIGYLDFIFFLSYSNDKFNFKFNNKKVNTIIEKPIGEIISVSSKTIDKNKTEMSINFNEENLLLLLKQKQQQRETEIKNYYYNPVQIQRQGIQLLESLNILNTTMNLDTLIGRFEFINKMYDEFIKASYNKRYISDIQLAIDQYKIMYYDKIINDFELNLIVKPNQKKLNEYNTICLFNCFNSFYDNQMLQIEDLKKDDAKIRRKEKIIEIGNQTIYELDRSDLEKNKLKIYIDSIKIKLQSLNHFHLKAISIESEIELKVDNPFLINKNDSFELTLYNAEQLIIQKVIKIIKDNNSWNKSNNILPLFSLYDIKCKEVDEYILKYKPLYFDTLQKHLNKSKEYQNSTEKDKEIIENEIKEKVINKLPERADCNLEVLFKYSDIDFSIDNSIVEKYGFELVSKYFGLIHYKDKIITHLERKDFEDLIKADLVITSEQIEQEEILNCQSLKTLNLICEKEDGFFKRKNKAIEYFKENEMLLINFGKYIATRNIFKLKALPEEFKDLDIEKIENHWIFLEEYIHLITNTYQNSHRNHEEISGENSWIESFSVEKFEDFNSNFVCLRAREECKKKYSKSNPPKLPFHIGCNCELRID